MTRINKKLSGFTLIELMITVAIVGVLAAIAIPSYNQYIYTSCYSTAGWNMKSLESHMENDFLENLEYLSGTHTPGDTSNNLLDKLHWKPDDHDTFKYVVVGTKTGYTLTVSGADRCGVVKDFSVTH